MLLRCDELFLPALAMGAILSLGAPYIFIGAYLFHNITEKYAKGRSTGGQRQNISGPC